jgi:hypothetical protein
MRHDFLIKGKYARDTKFCKKKTVRYELSNYMESNFIT